MASNVTLKMFADADSLVAGYTVYNTVALENVATEASLDYCQFRRTQAFGSVLAQNDHPPHAAGIFPNHRLTVYFRISED
jgi:hypothetical protein